MSDVAAPEAFVCDMVRARKEHRCCECGNPIRKGCRYERVSGIWDGRPARFKTCLICRFIRHRWKGTRSHWSESDVAFGELYLTIRESVGVGRQERVL